VREVVRALVLARDLLLALLALPFLLPLRLLPWRAAGALGSLYGLAAWPFLGKDRRAGLVNLRRAYGASMSRAEAGRAVRTVFANLGRSLAEGIRFSALAARGTERAFCWTIRDHQARFFYERMGGQRIAERRQRLWGTDVDQAAYGWPDLKAAASRIGSFSAR